MNRSRLLLLLVGVMAMFQLPSQSASIHFRLNQAGYLPQDNKKILVLTDYQPEGDFALINLGTGKAVLLNRPQPVTATTWGPFKHGFEIDLSNISTPGTYRIQWDGRHSTPFKIHPYSYRGMPDTLLTFMRQQRCGYNPFLDVACHQQDGRSFYGPMPDSSFVDVSGGWHDAGDQLKYLITSSFATAAMLYAYELSPAVFGDACNALGQPGANGLPDVLDEARWGLDWLHKMHPAPGQLFHQVADDRDHVGWKWPHKDPSNFGWGPNSYRAAYFADGKPQGLGKYPSEATGIGNLAGRTAAAMAIGYRVLLRQEGQQAYAASCLEAARDLFQMGREKEGFQQGNSVGAPYRYTEDSWADDMEWGAAELYSATGEKDYLTAAKRYARLAANQTWMPHDTAAHYKYYPFVNFGHFALYPHVDRAFQDTLAGYYRIGIEQCLQRAQKNAYQNGTPFIWCSNNLNTALITQIILYEQMTGDRRYHDLMLTHRDWLFGRNPWGTSMFTGMPQGSEWPLDVHTSVWRLSKRVVSGGLVDGPVYGKIYRKLIGLTLFEADEFAAFQNEYVVYHDDAGDYSTNEPTMDGTAGAVLLMAYFAQGGR